MAGRRGCVNSLWSGSERVRIGERLKATLAGIMELDLLRGRQLEMVDAVLDVNEAPAHQGEGQESAAEDGAATSHRQQVSEDVGKYHRNTMFLEMRNFNLNLVVEVEPCWWHLLNVSVALASSGARVA